MAPNGLALYSKSQAEKFENEEDWFTFSPGRAIHTIIYVRMLCVIFSTYSRHRIYFIYIWSNILMLFHMGMCMRLKITLHHNHLFTHEFDDYLLSSFYEPSPCNHCGTGRPSTRCTQSPSLRTLNCSLRSLHDLERGSSPFSAWANLCSSSLPFTLRDNSVLLIVRPSGKSNTHSLEFLR